MLAYGIDQNTGALTPVTGGEPPITYTYASQQFAFTPDGSHLFASGTVVSPTLQTTPAMFVFQVNANTGALTPVAGSPFALPLSPSALVMHPNAKFVYGITGESTLTAFGVDSAFGFGIHAVDNATFSPSATALAFDRTGSFLYVLSRATAANEGTDELRTFQVDATTGTLRQVGAPYPVPNTAACVLTR